MTATRPKLYLAGPDVFFPDAAARGGMLKACCREHGADGLFPIDNEIGSGAGMAARIRSANLGMIRDCDAVVANMMPFRGPAMDGGTAYEMGFGAALGRVVVGYQERNVLPFHRRVARAFGTGTENGAGSDRDRDGFLIEGFAGADGGIEPLADNLMMACGLDGMAGDAETAICLAVRLCRERLLANR